MLERVLARQQDIHSNYISYLAPECPDCTSDQTGRFSLVGPFPEACYCKSCGIVWQSYPARCPLCKGGWILAGLVRRHATDIEVQCEKCNEVLSVDLVKKCNEEEDFDLGDDL